MNVYAERTKKTASEKDKTGIPRKMKLGFERSSGFSFNDVRVHYNSEKPAQLRAHAYTQGNEVYVAPGQEKHLPHELGHVVQQKSDMVKPTGEIAGLPLNDDEEMENDADSIAAKAQTETPPDAAPVQGKFENGVVQRNAEDFNKYVSGVSELLKLGGSAFGFFHSSREKYVTQFEDYANEAEDTCLDAEKMCDEILQESDQREKIKKAIITKKSAQKAIDLSQRAAEKYDAKFSVRKSRSGKKINTRIAKTKERAEKCLIIVNEVLYRTGKSAKAEKSSDDASAETAQQQSQQQNSDNP